MEPMEIESVPRGCGRRIAGGAYACIPSGPNGLPVEYFIKDEPYLIEYAFGEEYAASLRESSNGVRLYERAGVFHIIDIVGQEFYPNVADYIEETRLQGVSRRLEIPDYSKITRDSKLMLIHAKAWIENADDYLAVMDDTERLFFCCPNEVINAYLQNAGRVVHLANQTGHHCAGLWNHDIDKLDALDGEDGRFGPRYLASGRSYRAYQRAEHITPQYKMAVFAVFPLHHIEVIHDDKDGKHAETMEKASKAGIETYLVREVFNEERD